MRIPCPFCGHRDVSEFSYLGDAAPLRPDPAASDVQERFHDFVYQRDNPAGVLSEFWYHGAGCRRWLKVERDTRTHEILAADFAQMERLR